MAGIIVDMSKIKQMLQLSEAGHSNRKIALELGINKETVNNYMQLIRNGRLDIRQLLKMDDPELERRFHAGNPAYTDSRMKTFLEELPVMKASLSQKHVTRFLVWQEYIGRHPDGYGKSQFFYHLKQNLVAAKGPSAVLTDTYLPGEKLYVDFAGDKLEYVDPETGEIIKVEVFVATLPYSDYAYAVCVPSQKLEDFVHAIRMCLEYIGGVPLILVTDNLKAAVVKADRYEPKLNKGLEDMGNFYHFAVVPCQPRSPTQKALVEDEVRLVYRRIYARLRGRQFYSLQDLNKAVQALLKDHNQTRMQKRPYSREGYRQKGIPGVTMALKDWSRVHILGCRRQLKAWKRIPQEASAPLP
jgi:transposase